MNVCVSRTADRIAHRYAWRGTMPKAANDQRHGVLCGCVRCEWHKPKPVA